MSRHYDHSKPGLGAGIPFTKEQVGVFFLEKIKLAAELPTSMIALNEIGFDAWVEHASRTLYARISSTILAEQIGQHSETVKLTCSLTTTVEVPNTWADHFKQTYGPETWLGWAFRLIWPGPVVLRKETRTESVTDMKTVRYRQMVGYPKLKYAMPDNKNLQEIHFIQRIP